MLGSSLLVDLLVISFGFIGIVTEISVLLFIYMNEKLFQMTTSMKKVVKNARLIGKPLFILIAYIAMLLELIPNIIAIIIVGTISFFQYLSDKNRTYLECFLGHFSYGHY